MFDSTTEVEVKIPSPDGAKTAVLTFPEDQAWIDRMRSQRMTIRNLGRGKSTTEVADFSSADKQLFDSIKVSGDDFDAYEAQRAIAKLAQAEVEEGERDGNAFSIPIRTIAGMTTHVLRIPSQKELNDYQKRSVSIVDGRHGRQEVKINLQASGDLYDKVVVKSEGYTGPVPVVHKSAAVNELLALLRLEEEEECDPEA